MATNSSYLVLIQQYGSAGTNTPVISVTAPIPESVNFDLSATYEPLLPQGFTKNNFLNTAAAAMGVRLAVQSLTAQLWTGSTTGDLNINLEFHTETDPVADVRNPIVNLMKLITPSVSTATGMMQSPGPQLDFKTLASIAQDATTSALGSVAQVKSATGGAATNIIQGVLNTFGVGANNTSTATMNSANTQVFSSAGSTVPQQLQQNPQLGTAQYWSSKVSNRISIRVGNYMYFDNVVITHLGHTFSSTFDATTGLPHHVIVQLSFRPMFVLSQSDIDNLYLNPTSNTTPGNNNYGFSIPNATGAAAGNVTSQFGLSNTFGYT
jgi:hypothetical protein